MLPPPGDDPTTESRAAGLAVLGRRLAAIGAALEDPVGGPPPIGRLQALTARYCQAVAELIEALADRPARARGRSQRRLDELVAAGELLRARAGMLAEEGIIARATGMLAARRGITPERALGLLGAHARSSGQGVDYLAGQILAGTLEL